MKIVGGGSDKKNGINVKVTVICACLCLLVVGVVAGFVFGNKGKASDDPIVDEIETEATVTDGLDMMKVDTEETKEPEIQRTEVEEEIARVTSYTGISSSEEDLVQLVKNTVIHANEWVTDATKETVNRHEELIAVLDKLKAMEVSGEDVDTKAVSEDEAFRVTGRDSNGNENVELTYRNLAGSVGDAIFYNLDNVSEYYADRNTLEEFILDTGYSWDVGKMSNFVVDASNDRNLEDINGYQYRVNYIVSFDLSRDANGDGQEETSNYSALIGNMDDQYIVLDVMLSSMVSESTNGREEVSVAADPVAPVVKPSGASGNAGSTTNEPKDGDGGEWTDDGYVEYEQPEDPNASDPWADLPTEVKDLTNGMVGGQAAEESGIPAPGAY